MNSTEATREPFELPSQLRRDLARRLTDRSDIEVTTALAQIARDLPDLVVDAEFRQLTIEIIKTAYRSLSATLLAEAVGQDPLITLAEEIVSRLADRGTGAEVVDTVFLNASRVFVKDVVSATIEVLPADVALRVLPALVDVVLAQLTARHRDMVRAFYDRQRLHQRRSDAVLQARIRSVLAGDITDDALASRLLGHPVSAWNLAAVVRPRYDVDEAINGLEQRLRQALQGGRTLVMNMAEDMVALWGASPSPPAKQHWAEQLRKDDSLVGAFGEPGRGIAGFVRTYEQAMAAFRVVTASAAGPSAADYGEIAPLTFMVQAPGRTNHWLRATLGALAAPGDDAERLRFTLRHYLASGENASITASHLYIHRNTVNYRITQAIEMLPEGLDGHRTDVALALDLLAWIPDVTDAADTAGK